MYRVYTKSALSNRFIPVGPDTPNKQEAVRRTIRHHGYFVRLPKKLEGQVLSENGPHFIKQDVSSGEDVCLS